MFSVTMEMRGLAAVSMLELVNRQWMNTFLFFLNLSQTDLSIHPELIGRRFNTQRLCIWGTFLPLHTHAQKRELVQSPAKGGHVHTRHNCLPDLHASRTGRNTFQAASVFCDSSLSYLSIIRPRFPNDAYQLLNYKPADFILSQLTKYLIKTKVTLWCMKNYLQHPQSKPQCTKGFFITLRTSGHRHQLNSKHIHQ